jgi:dihydroorotase
MYIDTHVHLRDFNQSQKETVKHGLEVARDSGLVGIFEMPNTNPPIIDRKTLEKRIRLGKDANVPEVFHGIYLGATADPEQLKESIDLYRKNKQVVGFKLYAGESVGDLAVIDYSDQIIIYNTFSQEEYNGVLAVHCEKESEMDRSLFDPIFPITHCLARPESAEVASVKDQIMLAKKYGFKGKPHIAHISSPKSIEIVQTAKKDGLDISCAVCPHHLFYNERIMDSENGILWKMNPPLRSEGSPEKMLEYLRNGEIDWMETDHAPHTLDEKTKEGYLSGLPALASWPVFIEFLRFKGFSEKRIQEVTFLNPVERFCIDLTNKSRRIKLVDRRRDYAFNAFKSMEELIGWRPQE